MTDPYKILGVSPTATDGEIKKAYHALVKKYHPDNYADNPLADLASEKMKEINEAYDTITKARSAQSSQQSTGGYSGYGTGSYQQSGYQQSGYQQSGYQGHSQFTQVRQYIHANQLDAAEALLSGMSPQNAEWYYLKGEIAYRRGWLDEARQCFQTAYSMEPGNGNYRVALSRVQGTYTPYRQVNYQNSDLDTACNICNTLLCLQCMCGGCGR